MHHIACVLAAAIMLALNRIAYNKNTTANASDETRDYLLDLLLVPRLTTSTLSTYFSVLAIQHGKYKFNLIAIGCFEIWALLDWKTVAASMQR